MRIYIFLVLMLVNAQLGISQQYSGFDFAPPLDIPMKLSGTFGELRSNHFHSGIDIKTGEREGLKVFAIEKGYVSRIKIQSGGYGRALYITHPNGFVSVYGHLSKYNTIIEEYVIKSQYKRQSYELDLYPETSQFPVEQGEIIALSGNTGRSGGPHLHFEIRSAADQKPINPLLFNYSVADNVSPVINVIKIYPEGPGSTVEGSFKPKDFFTRNKGRYYALNNKDTINASGTILFGVNTYDPFNGGNNKNGVYSIQLFVDDQEIYGHQLTTFSFDETRYINSFIDYKEYKDKSRRVQRSFIDPNNHLSIYTTKNDHGLKVEAGNLYSIRYEIKDISGNAAVLKFWVRGNSAKDGKMDASQSKNGPLFSYRKNNEFNAENLSLEVPGRALYNDFYFEYEVSATKPGLFSDVHRLHYETVPLHSYCKLSIRPDSLPQRWADKALIVKIKKDGTYSSYGGTYQNGKLHTKTREFGNYCIVLDTIPPNIRPVNIKNNKSLLAQNTIKVKITDERSGIKSYDAYLGNEWILMEYDAKNDLLIYRFDHKLKEGDNEFKLLVVDERDNISEYSVNLKY